VGGAIDMQMQMWMLLPVRSGLVTAWCLVFIASFLFVSAPSTKLSFFLSAFIFIFILVDILGLF
jgi:hypothetical protein